MSEQHPLKQPLVLLMTEVKESAVLMKALADEILNLAQDVNEALVDLERRVEALEKGCAICGAEVPEREGTLFGSLRKYLCDDCSELLKYFVRHEIGEALKKVSGKA